MRQPDSQPTPAYHSQDRCNVSLPLLLKESAGIPRRNEPITVGVPFPKGTMFSVADLLLCDPDNRPIPLQAQALARWSDGSVKWALCDFLATVGANATVEYRLRHAEGPAPQGGPPALVMRRTRHGVVIETGYATFVLPTRVFKLFDRVTIQGIECIDGTNCYVRLMDGADREYEPEIENIEEETEGPIRLTLKIRGKLCSPQQPPLADFVSRLSFYAGSGLVRGTFTLRNPRAATHPGGFWDLGDPHSIYVKDLSIRTTFCAAGQRRIRWGTEITEGVSDGTQGEIEIYQDSSGGENWRSTNHVNRFGRVMNVFPGYRVTGDGLLLREGRRATPVLVLYDDEKSLAGAIEHFWQNFPKALTVQQDTLSLALFPPQYSDVHEVQPGEQKTHTFFLRFDNQRHPPEGFHWVHAPLVAHTTPEWYANSGAISYVTPWSQDTNADCLTLVEQAVHGTNTFFDRREVIDEYGWRHFGDLYADHEAVGYQGDRPLVAHYNNQYDVIYGALVQYVRTADSRWFRLMTDLARHVVDIDIYHTQADKAAYNGGLFWHTEHYTDAATATHRAFSKASLQVRSPELCGGGLSCEHNYTTGLLHYYWLTGDVAAGEAVQELANWVINMDDGSSSVFGLLDKRPAGRCSSTASRYYHGPGRGCGNSINALLDAHVLTQEGKYLDKAEQLIQRCIHPQDDIRQRDLENVEVRWSYTAFLQVLGKYLDFKIEKNAVDYMYSYARASLLHYATWMSEKEVPYNDVLDKVEIPTETWPAQDIRKSNVFAFAAKHGEGALRQTFWEKSAFFFQACINDLRSFPTRTLTRPIVLLMTNGYVHTYFQLHPEESAPAPTGRYDFGRPQRFVPQLYELYKAREQIAMCKRRFGETRRRLRSALSALLPQGEGSRG